MVSQSRWNRRVRIEALIRALDRQHGLFLCLPLTRALSLAIDLWDTAVVDDVATVSGRFDSILGGTKDFGSPSGRVALALWRTHRRKFIGAGLVKLFHDCFMFSNPLLLEALLRHLSREDASRAVGISLAVGLAASSVVQTVAINVYFHKVFRICAQVKTQLIWTLYNKALRIDSSAKGEMGVGAIVNLQANDASKLYKLPQYLHMLWSAPFQILTVMAMLIRILHVLPAVAGLAVTVLLIPLSSLVARRLGQIRKRIVKLTDARVKLASEVILGIKAIKLYAWEDAYEERILELRRQELRAIRAAALTGLWNSMLWLGGPILISMAAFATYTWMGYTLSAAVAFPALALFNLLRFPVMMFPTQLENIINARVAIDRIQEFMEKEDTKHRVSGVGGGIQIKGSFGWGGAEPIVSLDVKVDSGKLIMVIGEVGSGKSSLLQAILGEMRSGGNPAVVKVDGTIAYTQQDPWIQNMSVRDNILLGRELDHERYQRVVRACALEPDLRILPAGDLTEIGEKGVNLSGGQRHRVALARACYQDADIYLLDDPLSAVDAHVGRHLMDQCITGLLDGKTRVLVTHQLQYLASSDAVIVLSKGGNVVEHDSYENLLSKGLDFHQFEVVESGDEDRVDEDGIDEDGIDEDGIDEDGVDEDGVDEDIVGARGGNVDDASEDAPRKSSDSVARDGANQSEPSRTATGFNAVVLTDNDQANDDSGKGLKITKAEERAIGQVEHRVYWRYFGVWRTPELPGFLLPLLVLTLAFLEKGLQSGQSWWLSVWSTAVEVAPATEEQDDAMYYMKWYFVIGIISLVVQIARQVGLVLGALVAAGNLHRSLLDTVLALPMSFFDTQPTGRLLNRFTKDIEAVDTSLQSSLSSFLSCSVSVLWSLVVVVVVSPATAVAFFPITFAYARIQRMYVSSSRELKRLDSLAMSPIFSIFSETLLGLATVRAFRVEHTFRKNAHGFLEESNRCFWPIQCVNRWLSIRLELTGALIVLSSAVVVSGIFPSSPGLAGLAITSALSLTGLLSWMVRQTSELEVNMNSVERLVEYDDEPREAPAVVAERRPLPDWPTRGEMLVEDLWVRYRDVDSWVLKGISFRVAGGESVGIVGRTGCGKSTLLSSILRLVEPNMGRVVIDGVDVGTIGLRDLRSRISLVAQDCVLFDGSIRSNLDPFSMAADDVIWDALSSAGLSSTVREMGGLDAAIAENGSNLSQGQRQLVSLARALLRNSRILILDEATSSIDTATDVVVQQTIRRAFADSTVLTIAHRIHTIIDSDNILVLDAGKVAEFGPPAELMAQDGAFSKLVKSAGKSHKP